MFATNRLNAEMGVSPANDQMFFALGAGQVLEREVHPDRHGDDRGSGDGGQPLHRLDPHGRVDYLDDAEDHVPEEPGAEPGEVLHDAVDGQGSEVGLDAEPDRGDDPAGHGGQVGADRAEGRP
jgi:hypothetical protein